MFGKTNKGLIYLFGALGGLLYGYDTGVISGALLFIKQDISLTNFMQGLVVSALLIGAIVGAGLSGPLSDRWGRRRVVLMIALIYILGALGAAFSPNASHARYFKNRNWFGRRRINGACSRLFIRNGANKSEWVTCFIKSVNDHHWHSARIRH